MKHRLEKGRTRPTSEVAYSRAAGTLPEPEVSITYDATGVKAAPP